MDIHIVVGGQQIGPFSPAETRQRLAAGEFKLNDLAWTPGQTNWAPLSTLPGFAPAYAPPPLPSAPPNYAPQGQYPGGGQPRQTSGLAIASLIFGILSIFVLPIIAALPAVVCGHVARSQIKRAAASIGGEGMALAGLIMGYLSFALIPVIAILAGIALPVFGAVQEKGLETKALSNAKQIATGCKLYAVDHGGAYPANLNELVPDYIPTPDIFVCPLDLSDPMGYDYFPGRDTDPPDKVLLVSKNTGKHKRRIVIYSNTAGRVVPLAVPLPTPIRQ